MSSAKFDPLPSGFLWEMIVSIKSYSISLGVLASATSLSRAYICLTSSQIHSKKKKLSAMPEIPKKFHCSWSIWRGGSKQKMKSAGNQQTKWRACGWEPVNLSPTPLGIVLVYTCRCHILLVPLVESVEQAAGSMVKGIEKGGGRKEASYQEKEERALSAFPGFYLLALEPSPLFCSTGFWFKLALNETELKYDEVAFGWLCFAFKSLKNIAFQILNDSLVQGIIWVWG